jgi:tetratricopeptide (TPR) repeat protein
MARATQDPGALAVALGRAWTLIDGSRPFSAEMTALFDEAEVVAERSGHLTSLAVAYRSQSFMAGCRGDRVEMDRYRTLARPLVERLRLPQMRASLVNDDAAFAAFAGELDLAERLTFEGVEAGSAAGFSESGRVSILGALLYQIMLCQGRVGDLAGLLAERVEENPEAPVWRVALAGALVESNRVDEARPHFDYLAANECANVLPDIEYPVIMCGLGRLSFRIEPGEAVLRPIYEKLAPFAGQFNWSGSTITDANDLGLGLAAATLGEHDAADAHFAAAIDLCERAGARAYLARTMFDWARTLDARGDGARARELAERALALGTELGMDGPSGVVPRAKALLA